MKIKDKIELAKKLEEKISQFNGIWFTNFTGLNVQNIRMIRQDLRKNLLEYRVVKNSILKRVLDNLKIEPLNEWLDGATAICIGNDVITGARTLIKLQNEFEKFKIKGGYFDNRILSLKDIEEIAKITDYKTLLTKLINNLFFPINNFVWATKNLFVKVVIVLDEIIKKKGE